MNPSNELVVFIHGYLRSSFQLKTIGKFFRENGYSISYIDYRSTKYNIKEISDLFVSPILQNSTHFDKIHFITHSAGGIVVRYFLQNNKLKNLGKVILLSPPNQGSEVADFLSRFGVFRFFLGPMLKELTTYETSFVNSLKLPDYEYGVIMGNFSNDPISSFIIGEENDGKVSIQRSKLPNMKDFLLVKRTHSFIMYAEEVKQACLHFIRYGKFT